MNETLAVILVVLLFNLGWWGVLLGGAAYLLKGDDYGNSDR